MPSLRFLVGLLSATMIGLAACGAPPSGSSHKSAGVGSGNLLGAGSTFVQPFFQAAFYRYQQKYPQVTVNYQPIGSGAGIKQFSGGTVDFGASDVPMNSSEIQAAGGPDELVQIPDTLGAVAIAYNLPGVTKLKLDGPTLAGIYLGKVRNWSDPAISALNPGITLPSLPITVAHRADGSGTTYIFTDYLSKISREWSSGVGTGKSVQWPVGVGGKGNQAVAQQVLQTRGGIGYVELAYVVQANMHQAYLKNSAGTFLQGSVKGATAAAAHASNITPADFSIVDEPGSDSYPIAGFSWVILHKSYTSSAKAKAEALVHLFEWFDTSGQQYGAPLQYAPLPASVQKLAISTLKTITVNGKPVLGLTPYA